MNVRDYYALRNRKNVYGTLDGLTEVYESKLDKLERELEGKVWERNTHRRGLQKLEKEIPSLSLRVAKLKQKLQTIKDQEHINKMLLDYDEILIFPGSRYRYLLP